VDARDVETALAITPRFYPAALDFGRWPEVLQDLAAVFAARAAQVNLIDTNGPELVAASQFGAPDALFAAYMALDDHMAADPRLAKSLELPNRPFSERQVMPLAAWHGSRMYREVFAPFGFDSVLGTYVVVEEDDVSAVIGVMRGAGDPDFTDDDVARFHLYLPHFREAVRCAVRVHRAETRADALAELFDRMRVATVVTDRFGAVQYRNAAARALIAEADGIAAPHDRIVAAEPAATRALHEAIFRTAVGTQDAAARALVRLPRRGRATDLLVSVARIEAGGPAHRLRAALFVLDPEARYEGDAEALQRLFGLTQAEAAVMVAIGAGRTPRETAAALGRSYETVRTHLKAIYSRPAPARRPIWPAWSRPWPAPIAAAAREAETISGQSPRRRPRDAGAGKPVPPRHGECDARRRGREHARSDRTPRIKSR
jgi:DNA-binding CsgD family transcriptional regulator